MGEDRSHMVVTKIYDNDGDLIKMTSSHVPGDYLYTESDEQYLKWLDENRSKRTIVIEE